MLPIIISIPHASTTVPEELVDDVNMSEHDLHANSDVYTDQIYEIPNTYIVKCDIPRVLLDVNRAPDDISKEYAGAGDGVVVHKTWHGKPIYHREPTVREVGRRIQKYHDPFHAEIDSYIPAAQFLIDGHSFLPVAPSSKPDAGQERPDINLGNMNYSTCTREHTVFFREFFERHGFTVAINFPYQGRYTLGRHTHRRRIPHFLVPGIQIEFNQKLYADEDTLAPKQDQIRLLNGLMVDITDEFLREFGMV